MSEDYKITWEDVKKVYNDRTLSGHEIVRKLRELFEVEFFKSIIEINQTELDHRLEELKKQREKNEKELV